MKLWKIIAYFSLFFIILYRISISFSYKYELCNGENNNIWSIANETTNHYKLYTDPEKLPIVIYPYTPLSEYPIILISKLFDSSSKDFIHNITITGRLYQLFTSLLLIFLIFKICRNQLGIDKLTSLFTCILILGLQLPTSMSIRPDATFYCFIVLSIYLTLNYLKTQTILNLLLISISYTLTFYTKQDGLFLVIPILLIFILYKIKKTHLLLFALLSLLNFAIIYSLLNNSYGHNFIKNTITGIQNVSSVSQLLYIFFRFSDYYLFHLIAFITISAIYLKKEKKEKIITSIYIFTSFYLLLAFILISKHGSWINYFYPFIVLSSIIITYYFNKLKINIFIMYMIILLIFNIKIFYNYTSPAVLQKNNKEIYNKKYNELTRIREKYNIRKNDFVLIADILQRTMLFKNSIMINTEYFSFTKFRYSDFRTLQSKNIKYIIFKNGENQIIEYLILFFNLDLDNYKLNKFQEYTIYKLK